ncbi:LytR/AlgR family response regulator transcription factor [Puia dinghuensis]|uniref:DNA-binding response regulator n=1 Tax=Puia dinghuensis TaxID=1792502 RepID=A0A8J2UBV2_9BACT|nr:LytTR family DNA-binding domain-containing protein [Puia dinghuensis]GGA93857.1 DNA-binding response regulator [Puia dinghuensis]
MQWKCLIVDDEPPALKILRSYLESTDNLQLIGACHNAFEAMQLLRQQPVDLIFLDIRMPRLLGTEFIRTLRHPPKVIFTTAHADYALEGFDLDAVDYLLKPFSFERFLRAVNKFTGESLATSVTPAAGKTLAAGRSPAETPEAAPFLYFRVDRKMVKVRLDEIVYIESLKDYSRIIRTDQKPLVMKKPIGSIEEMLPAHLFLRIHRSFIIAIHKVTAYTHTGVEIGGQDIPVGKLYRHQLEKLALSGPR